MNRTCRIGGCTKPARPNKRICRMHAYRITRYGDPNFTVWTAADECDVDLIVRDPRPVDGLTRRERLLVARGLTERAVPAEEIARIVGVTPRSVYRWRSEGFRQAA
ncbi:helix-turn-helix domain-containing protein [Streptomyces sp. NPDC059916]|uniref:helix-turn-helix domain-containing protein n=1 Tax=Streptomyces sp. NPDC059916 TaxID=3347001 RepID=UPI00369AD1BB